MFCPDCFKLLDDDNNCTNPACPSYSGNGETIIETNTIDTTQTNKNADNEVFKQPKVNTISEELFKQPKINTVSEELFKQPKINTVNKELSKQPKANTISEEIFKQPKVNTISEELFKQPKINTVSEELFKQPKINTVSEELFKQPKINSESIQSSKINTINDKIAGQAENNTIDEELAINNKINSISENFIKEKEMITESIDDSYDNDNFTKAVPIITESMLNNANIDVNSNLEDDFTKAIPIISESMLNNEDISTVKHNKDVVDDNNNNNEDIPFEEPVRKQTKKRSDSKKKEIQKESTKNIKDERETPRLDDYFNDDLVDADELIDNSSDKAVSEKEMLLAFVGKKKRTYYSTHIDTYLKNKNFISFNPCAFLFTLWWFWYRKVYIAAAAIGVICLGSIAVFNGLKLIVLLPIALFGGLLGNQIYLKSASKRIDKINSNNSTKDMDNRTLLKLLKSEGGTTNIPIIIFIILVIAIIIALTFSVAFVANMIMGAGTL